MPMLGHTIASFSRPVVSTSGEGGDFSTASTIAFCAACVRKEISYLLFLSPLLIRLTLDPQTGSSGIDSCQGMLNLNQLARGREGCE